MFHSFTHASFFRNYAFSSMFPLFHYLFVTSPYYISKVSIVSLSVCYIIASFYVSIDCLFLCFLRHYTISLQCFCCFIICLLRHHTISSRFSLFHYLLFTPLLCSMLRLSLSLFLTSL